MLPGTYFASPIQPIEDDLDAAHVDGRYLMEWRGALKQAHTSSMSVQVGSGIVIEG
jgi:hypothetical protein